MLVCVCMIKQLHNFIPASTVVNVCLCEPDLLTQVIPVYFFCYIWICVRMCMCMCVSKWLNRALFYIHYSACQGDYLVTEYNQLSFHCPPFPSRSIHTHSHCDKPKSVFQPFQMFYVLFYFSLWACLKYKCKDMILYTFFFLLGFVNLTCHCGRAVLLSSVLFYSSLSCFVQVFTLAVSGLFCFVTVYQLNLMLVCLSILWRMSGHWLKKPDKLSSLYIL